MRSVTEFDCGSQTVALRMPIPHATIHVSRPGLALHHTRSFRSALPPSAVRSPSIPHTSLASAEEDGRRRRPSPDERRRMSSAELEVHSHSWTGPRSADGDGGEEQVWEEEEHVFEEVQADSDSEDEHTVASGHKANGLVVADAADDDDDAAPISPPASIPADHPQAQGIEQPSTLDLGDAARRKSEKTARQRERKKAKRQEERARKESPRPASLERGKRPIPTATNNDIIQVDWALASSSSKLDWSAEPNDVDVPDRPSSSSSPLPSSRHPRVHTPRPGSNASMRSGGSQIPPHPSVTPRVGKFWNHDDRRVGEEDHSGPWTAVANKRRQAKAQRDGYDDLDGGESRAGGRSAAKVAEEEPWRHDRFEELERRNWRSRTDEL
jgi:CASC3/Barentsz eIF4AIII binding